MRLLTIVMHTRCGTTEKTAEKETSSPNDLQTTEERKWNMFYGEKKEQIQKKIAKDLVF